MQRSTTASAEANSPLPAGPARWLLPTALLFPTALTLIYFVWMASAPGAIQRVVFGVAKLAQFLLPIVWWQGRRQATLPHSDTARFRSTLSQTASPSMAPSSPVSAPTGRPESHPAGPPTAPPSVWYPSPCPSRRPSALRGSLLGLGMGVVMAALMLLGAAGLEAAGLFAPAIPTIRLKLAGVGVQTAADFAALACFYCLAHSLLEEYYFRWFLWRLCDEARPGLPAHLLAAVGFMSHHVVVLAFYFGGLHPMTWLGSLAVAIAGLAWSWLYEATGRLWPSWIAHILADAAIFGFGYHLLTFPITAP